MKCQMLKSTLKKYIMLKMAMHVLFSLQGLIDEALKKQY